VPLKIAFRMTMVYPHIFGRKSKAVAPLYAM
jgi:hypothetical protein